MDESVKETDKHKPIRTVPMKVLVLGHSRTGTLSTKQALEHLNHKPCYHMATLLQNPTHAETWIKALEAKYEHKSPSFTTADWDALLGEYQAVTDHPCAAFAEELMCAYPDAKVILTVRDSVEEWAASSLRLKGLWEATAPTGLMKFVRYYFTPRDTRASAAGNVIDLLMKHVYGDDPRIYVEHNERVRKFCREQGREMLVFNVKEGWGPLCAFLGEEVPGEPFPRTHGRESEEVKVWRTQRRRNVAAVVNMVKTIGGPVALMLSAYFVLRYVR